MARHSSGAVSAKVGSPGWFVVGFLPERAALTRSTSASFLASATLRVFRGPGP